MVAPVLPVAAAPAVKKLKVSRFQHVVIAGSQETADRRMNIVVLPEGFTDIQGQSQLDTFITLVESFKTRLFAAPPFDRMRGAINIVALRVPSTDTATLIDRECSPHLPSSYRTAFGARFCKGKTAVGQPIPREINGNSALVIKTVQDEPGLEAFKHYLVLVNSTLFGGTSQDTTSGSVAWVSIHPNWQATAIHELGHQAFNLADEYHYEESKEEHRPFHGDEPSELNVSITLPLKKKVWVSKLTVTNSNKPITPPNPKCKPVTAQTQSAPDTVAAFEGARYFLCKIFRPALNCRMRDNALNFCPVCQQLITEKLGKRRFGNAQTRPERPLNLLGQVVAYQPDDIDVEPRFLAYDMGTGAFSVYSCRQLVEQDTSPVLAQGNIPPLFTSLVATHFNDSAGLLATQIGSDNAILFQISNDGTQLTEKWHNPPSALPAALPFGIKQVTPFSANAVPHYLDYDFASGIATIRRINLSTNTSTVVRSVNFPAGCTGFNAFDVPDPATGSPVTHFVVYNPLDGSLRIERFNGDDVALVASLPKLLKPGAVKVMPFLLPDGGRYLLVYSMATGLLQMFLFRRDLSQGLDFVYQENIGSQFFDFDFFSLVHPITHENLPFYLRYRFPIQRGRAVPQFFGTATNVAAFHAG